MLSDAFSHPSQKLKDIPTKCIFWVNFVGKTLRSDKKQFSCATKELSQDGDEIFVQTFFWVTFAGGRGAWPLPPLNTAL
jgi:hypothetical protein